MGVKSRWRRPRGNGGSGLFWGPADINSTSGLRETDIRDLPQRGQHVYSEEMEIA